MYQFVFPPDHESSLFPELSYWQWELSFKKYTFGNLKSLVSVLFIKQFFFFSFHLTALTSDKSFYVHIWLFQTFLSCHRWLHFCVSTISQNPPKFYGEFLIFLKLF